MKNLFLVLSLCIGLSVRAQFTWGVHAGANLSRGISSPDLGLRFKEAISTGFQAGVFAQVRIIKSWYFQPSVQFINKSYKLDPSDYLYYSNPFAAKYSINYISIPLLLTYQVKTSRGNFVFGSGAELNAGVSGRGNLEVDESGVISNHWHKLRFGNSKNDELRSFVFYPYLLAGYQTTKGLGIYLFGTPGLPVISSPGYQFINSLNTCGLSVSYLLTK